MNENNSAPKEREPQVAVAPLNTIAQEDVGAGAAAFDEWLKKFSGGYVTLERLTMVAGSLPVLGNIIALVDVLGDLARVVEKRTKKITIDFLDWVSLGINLIGVIPLPPGLGAARMSLRPALHLVKQNAVRGAKNLGESLVVVLVSHLNDRLAGEIEKFVEGAISRIGGLLKDCADLADKVTDGLIDVLQRCIGHKPLFDVATKVAPEPKRYDPRTQSVWNRMLAAAESARAAYVRMNKQAANVAASQAARLLPDSAKQGVLGVIGGLTDFKTSFRGSLTALANEQTERGIAWLLRMLLNAVQRHKKPKSALVSPQGTKVQKDRPNQPTEAISKQAPAKGDGTVCKLCPAPAGTKRSISYATGAETFTHVDFVLTATLPLAWSRTYRSQLEGYEQGPQGARWLTPFHTRVDAPLDGKKKSLVYRGSDGRSHDYPWHEVGESYYDPIEERTLTRVSASLLLIDPGKPLPAGQTPELRETYELVPTVPSKVEVQGPQHFRLIAIQTKEAGIGLRYDHQVASGANAGEHVLSDILSKQGEKTQAHVAVIPDEHGRIQALWQLKDGQPERQLAAYTYNEHGDLAHAQDENAASWTYQYDHHLITRYSDRTGRGINLQYDGTGPKAKAIREWADDGSFDTRLEWDKNIRLTYVTDAHGEETWVYYDIAGYPYRIIHPDHNEEWFFRDDAKNVNRHVHTDGSTDDYHHDEAGNVVAHVRVDGSRVHYEYDEHHRLTGILDPEGHTWKRSYNPQGQLEEETDPRGNKTQYAYDKQGRVSEVIDAKGGAKKLSYTEQGQLARYTDCSGRSTQWEYDERGRLIKITDAAKHSTVYRYTPVNEETLQKAHQDQPGNHPGQLEAVVYADQSEEQLCHDAEGRLLKHTDALKRSTSYSYNAAGLIAQRTDALGQQLSYVWDKLGRLKELKNENGRPYSFKYDPVGRLLEEVGFDGQATRYSYAEETGVLQEVKEGTLTTKLEFDEMGRLSKRTAILPGKDEQTESFGYYPGGQLGEAKNEQAKLQWFYDEAGNLIREHQHYLAEKLTAVWRHGYDELNHRIQTTRPDGHKLEWLTYGSGHVHGLVLDGLDVVGFERDALHREVHRTQLNGLAQSQRYDTLGRLLEQQITPSQFSAPVQMGERAFKYQPSHIATGPAAILRQYQYDKSGQLAHIEDNRRGRIEYRYDPVGQLLQATSPLGRETFAFDPAGNIVPPGETANARESRALPKVLDNLLKEYAGTHYRYDERGNLIERTQQGRKTTFEWDGFNRMARAIGSETTTQFAYDPLGRRIGKRHQAGANAQSQTLFGWDGDTLAFESEQVGGKEPSAQTVHYVHEAGSFVPLLQAVRPGLVRLMPTPDVQALMAASGDGYHAELDPLWNGELDEEEATPFSTDQMAFYQCDQIGTPQELTDAQGAVCWAAQYKAWGEAKELITEVARKVGFKNPIRFQGQYLDEETGLHYNRYRYYEPTSGRFVSRDPIRLHGGLNVHLYVQNPVRWIDPLGLVDINHFHSSEAIHDYAQKVPSNKKVFKVGGHGTPLHDADGNAMTPQELADQITAHPKYKKGMPVDLLSCNTGAGKDSYGQQLANKLGARVRAPDTLLWYYSDGKLVPAPRDSNNPDSPDLNNQGGMRSFAPQKTKKK